MNTVGPHQHVFRRYEWPFSDPENVLAISTVQVFRQGFPILLVTHDGDWQVLCGTTSDSKDAMVVCLGCAFQKDKTIGELADLPLGWRAWREQVGEPWFREARPPEDDAEENG